MKKYLLILALVLNCFATTVWAAQAFVVKKIDIQGLQRISPDTVYTYLPIQTGEVLRPEETGGVIASLYKTGFFAHISLDRNGNVLIIRVVERPTIGQIKISGNSSIPTDKLTGVMKSVDIAEGRVYNSAILEKIKQSLLNQYYQLGRYNARVNIDVTPMPRNRVLIKIEISEGLIAKVRRINIIGNHAFSEKTLDKQLQLTTPGLVTFFTQTDRYSQEKLDSSLEQLRNYYLDRGYIKFAVKSSQVAITPDRKSIYLTIVIDEGQQYHVKGVDIIGDTIIPRSEMMQKIVIHRGDLFSRQNIIDSEKNISDTLGDKGYLFAVVSLEPKIDDTNRLVFLTFIVKPGKRVYVRHIYFTDNAKTNDEVLRREVQQMESAPVSTARLDTSKHRLSLLPYLRDVQMTIQPIAESDDKVDIDYKVTEDQAAQATFSIGYSQVEHLILSAGLTQKNFLGTGQTLGLNISRSSGQQYLGINFTDPYYTINGISRTINLSASKYDPQYTNVTRSYTDDQYAASVVYGIPIGQAESVFTNLQLGYGYQDTLINLASHSNIISTQVKTYVNNHGRHFQEANLIAGISRDSRDRAIFPTTGMIHTLSLNLFLPVNAGSVKYYTTDYVARIYHPLVYNFIATARGQLGYGNAFSGPSDYPFFNNFYAGGMDSVRAYEGNTLGPKDDVLDGHGYGQPTGGNFLGTASIGLIFPNHISENLRTTLFVDGGNVYNTYDNRKYNGTGSGPIRYSTGIEADWLVTGLGLIDVSLGKALNPRPGDDRNFFQFSLGANFG